MLFGRELLARHVGKGKPQHQGNHGVVRVLLERGHVLAQRILQNTKLKQKNRTAFMSNHLVSSSHETIVPVENPEGEIVRISRHEPHEEPVVSDVVGPHDDQVEEVPDARVLHVLHHQLADKIVGVVTIAVEERGEQAEKLALLRKENTIMIFLNHLYYEWIFFTYPN